MQQTKRNKANARSFLNYIKFNFIVDACSLTSNHSWKKWYDEDGNKLIIKKNKGVVPYESNIKAEKTKDIFKKSLPEHIKNNSCWAISIEGDTQKVIVFLGNDKKLRACYFENNEWKKNISPILLGFNCLKTVEKHLMNKKESIQIACLLFEVNKSYSVCLPGDFKIC